MKMRSKNYNPGSILLLLSVFSAVLITSYGFQITPSTFAHTSSGQGLVVTDTHVQAPFDKIPRFCNAPNIPANTIVTSTKNGNWSDPTVWSNGQVPGTDARIQIAANTTVTYNVSSDATIRCIEVEDNGHLTFATNQNTKLVLDDGIIVMPLGTLTIGTSANPINAGNTVEIIFADTPLKTGTVGNGGIDPQQYGKLLAVFGDVRMYGAAKSPTFVRLAQEPHAGDTTLALRQVPTGWRVGDELLLPDTRMVGDDAQAIVQVVGEVDSATPSAIGDWTEKVTIQSIAGTTVTLTAPLQHDHLGARDDDNSQTVLPNGNPLLPHVGNMSRNITLSSANPSGTRYHTITLHRADVDIRYVRFKDGGRTRAEPLHNTTFDANVQPLQIGTNQIGRYSLHNHHVWGPVRPQGYTGNQLVEIGNVIDGFDKWGMTIHDTHYGLYTDNIIYDGHGAAVAFEDASEYRNIFDRNFMVNMAGKPQFAGVVGGHTGEFGNAIWSAGPMNIYRDNVMASVATGVDICPGEAGSGCSGPTGKFVVDIPNFPGADISNPAERTRVDATLRSPIEFDRNEVYGSNLGFFPWSNGDRSKPGYERFIIDDMVMWHIRLGWNVYVRTNAHVELNRFTARGTYKNISEHNAIRWRGGGDVTCIQCDIQGFQDGIFERGRSGSERFVLKDSYLSNVINNYNSIHWTQNVREQTVIFDNVRFGKPTHGEVSANHKNINMLDATTFADFPPQHTYMLNYNGVPGDDFQVFHHSQRPDAVVPTDGNPGFNRSPTELTACGGNTTVQCWLDFGYASSGQVAPCNDTTSRPEIDGITCPIDPTQFNNIQAFAGSAVANVPTGPVLHWRFDEGIGTAVSDSSGNGNTGMFTAGTGFASPTWTIDTPTTSFSNPQTLRFSPPSKTDSQIELTNYPDLFYDPIHGYSISFWIKGGNTQNRSLFREQGTITFTALSDGRVRVTLPQHPYSSTNSTERYSASSTIRDDTWHHVAWVDIGGRAALYVDGVKDATDFSYGLGKTATNAFTPFNSNLYEEPTTSRQLIVGNGPNNTFIGQLDDFRIYRRVLLPSEIAALASGQEGSVDTGLAASQEVLWNSNEPMEYEIEYGLDTTYGGTSVPTTGNQVTLTGLLPNTTYHYRIKSFNNTTKNYDGTGYLTASSQFFEAPTYSADQTFTTGGSTVAPPRLVITQPSPGSSTTSDTINVRYVATGDLTGSQADHIHFQLDNEPEVRGISLTGGTHTFQNVSPGQHTIKGYIAKADHNKVVGTDVSVTFTTTDPAPTPNIPPTISVDQASFTIQQNTTLIIPIIGQDQDGDILSLDIPDLSTLLPGAGFE